MSATNEVSVGERLSIGDCPLYEDEEPYALGAGLDTMLDPNPLLDAKGSVPPMRAKNRLITGRDVLADLLAEERRDLAISGPNISQWPWVDALNRMGTR